MKLSKEYTAELKEKRKQWAHEEKQELKQEKKAWNKMIRMAKKKDALIEGDFIKSIYTKGQ